MLRSRMFDQDSSNFVDLTLHSDKLSKEGDLVMLQKKRKCNVEVISNSEAAIGNNIIELANNLRWSERLH